MTNKRVLTPEIAAKILRRMGLISNHRNGYYEQALEDWLQHGDVDKAADDNCEEKEDY